MIKELCLSCIAMIMICKPHMSEIDNQFYITDNVVFVNDDKKKVLQNFNLDSVNIRVVFFTRPILEASYFLKGCCIDINSVAIDGDLYKKECKKDIVNQIKQYISKFYLNKEEKIILSKAKKEYLESTDYPYIKVIGYQNNKEVFNVNTQIRDEEYDIEYHPKFLEFYEFLDSLVKEK